MNVVFNQGYISFAQYALCFICLLVSIYMIIRSIERYVNIHLPPKQIALCLGGVAALSLIFRFCLNLNSTMFNFLLYISGLTCICILFYRHFMSALSIYFHHTAQFFACLGMLTGVIALWTNFPLKVVFEDMGSYSICFAGATVSLVLNAINEIKAYDYNNQLVFAAQSSRREMYNFLMSGLVLIYLLIYFSIYTAMDNSRMMVLWFTMSCLLAYLVIAGISKLISYLQKNEYFSSQFDRANKQLKVQLDHYQSMERYINSLRVFRHDYKKMMGSVNVLLANGNVEEARNLLYQINESMAKNVNMYQRYSNNNLVDAILQDMAHRCEEAHIRFEAQLTIPEKYSIDPMKLITVATNLIDNILEACEKVDEDKRFAKITSQYTGEWLTICASNSFAGTITQLANGRPVTTKKDKDAHGLGLLSVEQTISNAGGLFNYEVDNENHVFSCYISLPLPEDE